jgi:hypothetical protein
VALAPKTSSGASPPTTGASDRSLPGNAQVVDLEPGGVDRAAVAGGEQDERRDRADVVIRLPNREQLREGVRLDRAVVVDERHPVSAGLTKAGGDAARESEGRRPPGGERPGGK